MGTENFIVTSNFPEPEAAAEPKEASIAPKEEKKEVKVAPDEDSDDQTEDQESSGAEGDDSEDNDSDDSEENDSKDEPKPKKKSGYQKRLDRIRRQLVEKDALIRALQSKVPASTEADVQPVKEDQKAQSEGEPNPDDFDTQKDYVKAVVKWEREQERKAEAEKAKIEQAKSEYQKTTEAHQARVESYMKENPDYKEVLTNFIEDHGDLKFSPAMEELILTSEVGPQVLYELAKNKAELDRLNALAPLAAAREYGKIEDRIASSSSKKQEPKQVPKSKAPAPISPVSGKGGAVAKSIHDPDLPFEEYERLRNEELRKRA